MRYLLCAAALLAACDTADEANNADGTRGPCAAGGQIFGDDACPPVESVEDACWKLVDCGVIPVDNEADGIDWGRCVGRIEGYDAELANVAVACIDAASCEQLIVNDSPSNPYMWPDCLELR